MRHLSVWLIELLKIFGERRLHPLAAQCPFCGQMVRLHLNKAGRRHMLGHARALYEGSEFFVHYAAKTRCAGSRKPKIFHPRPNEHERFRLPNSLFRK